jgi:hypothetical protein
VGLLRDGAGEVGGRPATESSLYDSALHEYREQRVRVRMWEHVYAITRGATPRI